MLLIEALNEEDISLQSVKVKIRREAHPERRKSRFLKRGNLQLLYYNQREYDFVSKNVWLQRRKPEIVGSNPTGSAKLK
jgi:hypothetical protein